MLPSDNFLKLMRITRICAAACGADVIDRKYKVNIMTYLVWFCIVMYFIFSAYTVQLKISENWTIALESFCMVGSVFQGISKLLSAITYKDNYSSQSEFLYALYKNHETLGDDYMQVLNKCITRVRAVLRGVACMYVIVFVILVSVPLFIWAYTSHRLFVMQFYMPRVDPDTTHGYLITLGMQMICLLFGAFGNFAGDMFTMLFFAHTTLLVDIFELKTKELNELALEYGSRKVGDKLIDVIKWHQTYSNYVEITELIFFWTNFTQITTSGLSIVLTLVIVFTGDWPGAYWYIGLSFAMLYLYCGMGTLIEDANDRITSVIYAIHWYYLTVPQQKAIRFMLMKSQSPKQITVGGVVPLTVNTGLQVSKTVYSVFMMLLNMFD